MIRPDAKQIISFFFPKLDVVPVYLDSSKSGTIVETLQNFGEQ